jgi:hypothetical protein
MEMKLINQLNRNHWEREIEAKSSIKSFPRSHKAFRQFCAKLLVVVVDKPSEHADEVVSDVEMRCIVERFEVIDFVFTRYQEKIANVSKNCA